MHLHTRFIFPKRSLLFVHRKEFRLSRKRLFTPQRDFWLPWERSLAPQREFLLPWKRLFAPRREFWLSSMSLFAALKRNNPSWVLKTAARSAAQIIRLRFDGVTQFLQNWNLDSFPISFSKMRRQLSLILKRVRFKNSMKKELTFQYEC